MESPRGAHSEPSSQPVVNAMTVDVEDYFQVSAFESAVARANWEICERRVDRNIDAILDLFDERGARATFFVLGWIAERHPALVRRIAAQGHEIASHGHDHRRIHDQTRAAFGADIERSKKLLEDAIGQPVNGYRAPSFSLSDKTPWAYDVLIDAGHAYSSSVYPVRHDHYGAPEAPRFPFPPVPGEPFMEIPITTASVRGKNLPCGGGGYFRLFPYAYTRWGIRRFNSRDGARAVFYFHPWEIDPAQPRMANLTWRTRFRHYTNLRKMANKLHRLLTDFAWDRLDRVISPVQPQRSAETVP